MGLSEAGIYALRYPRSDSDGVVMEGTFPASGDVYVFFSKDRRTMKALKWDGDGFLMYTKRLSRGRFREVLKKDDDGVRRLQWDDFYMLMRGLTPVKVTVENRFRMAQNQNPII